MSRKKPMPWELQSTCECAVCVARRELANVRSVDTDAYHGSGALESLQYKMDFLVRALEALVEPLRCEKGNEP